MHVARHISFGAQMGEISSFRERQHMEFLQHFSTLYCYAGADMIILKNKTTMLRISISFLATVYLHTFLFVVKLTMLK